MPKVVNRYHHEHRVPPGAVYVGRPTKWGNPVRVTRADRASPERERAILARYEAHVRARPDLMAALGELRGRDLACYCAPLACHADVLLRLVEELFGDEASVPDDATCPWCDAPLRHGARCGCRGGR